MPLLECFACPADSAVGFVVPLFCQRPGANLLQIQLLDEFNRVNAFECIARETWPERQADQHVTVELRDPAIWAFLGPDGNIHVGTAGELRRRAPALLSSELIESWPASAADLLRLCELEDLLADQVRATYAALTSQLGPGAAIWRDTDLLLPLIRQQFGARLKSPASRPMLSDIWAQSIEDTCHVFCPAPLLKWGAPDLSRIVKIASAWGINVFTFHPQQNVAPKPEERIHSWLVTGAGGVGRWTVRRMWKAVGPLLNPDVWPRVESNALEARLTVPSATTATSPPPPQAHIVIHGSAQKDVETGRRLFGGKRPEMIQHVVNIRPLGKDPERRQAVPARVIVEDENGADYVWVIANHRPRKVDKHYDGLARSQVASRFARAGISALADLCSSPRGRMLVQGTAGAHAIGLVGATRYLADMSMRDLLLRVLYSMLSPEWTFADGAKLVCLWPHRVPDGSHEYVRLGSSRYLIEMIGIEQPSVRADVRCLAFGVSATPPGTEAYAEYVAAVMAAWGWSIHRHDGEAMLFVRQGGVVSMLIADTAAQLDAILRRDREIGAGVDFVVTNRSLNAAQNRMAQAGGWRVIHHSELPSWIPPALGQNGVMPVGDGDF